MDTLNTPLCPRDSRVRAAYRIMQTVFDHCQRTGQSKSQTHQAIRAAYPWGQRRAWPYKAWLAARREFYERHGLPLKAKPSIAESISGADV